MRLHPGMQTLLAAKTAKQQATEIRNARKAIPLHLAHRNAPGPQGVVARSCVRSNVATIRFLQGLV